MEHLRCPAASAFFLAQPSPASRPDGSNFRVERLLDRLCVCSLEMITMRRLMTSFWNVQSDGTERLQPYIQRISILLAIAGILCLTVAFGEDLKN
jgi:hypothetical protein